MAKAAAVADADWSKAISEAIASRADSRSPSGMPPAYPTGRDGDGWSSRRAARSPRPGLPRCCSGAVSPPCWRAANRRRSPTSRPPTRIRRRASPRRNPVRSLRRRSAVPARPARTETESQATTVASPLLTEAGKRAGGAAGRSPGSVGSPATAGDLHPEAKADTEPPVAARVRPGSPRRGTAVNGAAGRRPLAEAPLKRKRTPGRSAADQISELNVDFLRRHLLQRLRLIEQPCVAPC